MFVCLFENSAGISKGAPGGLYVERMEIPMMSRIVLECHPCLALVCYPWMDHCVWRLRCRIDCGVFKPQGSCPVYAGKSGKALDEYLGDRQYQRHAENTN